MVQEHLCVSLVPLFSQLSLSQQRQIMDLAYHRSYGKNEMVFRPGDEKLDIVAYGSVKVYEISPSGKQQVLRLVKAGGYEGEKQLFGIPNETLFGSAVEETRICTLRKQEFHQVLHNNPDLAIRLFELTAQKMVDVENQTVFLAMERVEERLASYLLSLSRASSRSQITLPMKMKDVARYLGTTPETLSRKLKFLETAGYIQRTGKEIRLLNRDALENL